MQVAETAQRKSELEQHKVQKDMDIAKLTAALDDINSRTSHAQKDLASKIDAEVMERKADNDCFLRELTTLKQTTDAWKLDETPQCILDIAEDVKKLAHHLWHVENARQSISYEGLWCLKSSEEGHETK